MATVAEKKAKKGRRGPAYSRAELKRLLEAVLFASDRPVPIALLCDVLGGPDETEVRRALEEMSREYEETGRSFVLREVGGGFLMLTHPAFEPWVRKLYRGRLTTRLSRSALETVAIVAYRQPVTKQAIEGIRGVNVDAVLHTLLERKLIRIVGRKEGLGRPLLYGTTRDFLMYLGLNDLSELPQLDEMKSILEAQELQPAGAEAAGPFEAAQISSSPAPAKTPGNEDGGQDDEEAEEETEDEGEEGEAEK